MARPAQFYRSARRNKAFREAGATKEWRGSNHAVYRFVDTARSKYAPHQNSREKARRLAKAEGA